MDRRLGYLVVGIAVLAVVFLIWQAGRGGREPASGLSDTDRGPGDATRVIDDAELQGAPGAGGRSVTGAGGTEAPLAGGEDADAAERRIVRAAFRGRVIDERRQPVAGAVVRLLDGSVELARAETDAAGSYAIAGDVDFGPPVTAEGLGGPRTTLRLILRALGKDGSAGATVIGAPDRGMPDEPLELWPLVLRTAHPLHVRVTADGEPLAGANVRVGGTPHGWNNQWHYLDAARTGVDGTVVFEALPAKTVSVVVLAPGRAMNLAATALPRGADEGPLVVELPPARSVEVQVLERGTGTAIEGATITLRATVPTPDRGWPEVMPLEAIPPTDADGLTRVAAPAPGIRAWARAEAVGRPCRRQDRYQAELTEEATRVTIELEANVSLRWPLVAGDGGLPADGTPVEVGDRGMVFFEWTTPGHGVIEAGHLVVPGAVAQTAHMAWALIARLPDGRIALPEVPQGEAEGGEIAFVEPRSVLVTVRDEAGEPVPDVRVFTGGLAYAFRPPPGHTDEKGQLRLSGLPPMTVQVTLHGKRSVLDRLTQEVDLADGDVEVAFEVPAEQTVRIQMMVDGEARLPPKYSLQIHELHPSPHAREEDPDRGEVRILLRTETPLEGAFVLLKAEGFGEARGKLARDPAKGDLFVRLELDSRTQLILTVAPPADRVFELFLEHWSPEYGYWYAMGRPVKPEPADQTAFTFGPLREGRFRVRERFTNLASEAVEVKRGSRADEARLDLSAVGTVRGRVEVPAGTSFAEVGVIVKGLIPEDEGPVPVQRVGPRSFQGPPEAQPVEADGTFEVRVPGDRDVAIEAWHALHGSAGAVTVREARDDIVLRLESGPVATFVLGSQVAARRLSHLVSRVLLYRGPATGTPAYTGLVQVNGREVAFGGYAPGVYTIWIDGVDFAPLVLSDVELTSGATALGEVAFAKGSTVHVDVTAAEGAKRPPLRIRMERIDAPRYLRSKIVMGNRDATVDGLGPGRFRLMVRSMERTAGAAILLDVEIEVDGETDVRVPLDLSR